jgi:Cu(I)/Ag(I) efflux system membrane fusion protein
MNRLVSVILLLAALSAWTALAQAQHPPGHGASSPPPGKKADNLDQLKGPTMEPIQKEVKVIEIAPETVEISPERQQLIGVKFETVQKRMMDKVIRTVGRIEYDEKRIGTVSPKIGGWIEDLYVDFTGRFVRKGTAAHLQPGARVHSGRIPLALKAKQDWSSPFAEVSEGGNFLAVSARRRLKLWDISDAQIKALEESREPRRP